jgi:hypothetical protein
MRWMFANQPEMAKKWVGKYGAYKPKKKARYKGKKR